ncbi:hypothetical protein PMAYCL1PPCAC_23899, partial [Pristionchus mayeri]
LSLHFFSLVSFLTARTGLNTWMEAIVQKLSRGLDAVPKLARHLYSSVIASFSSLDGETPPPRLPRDTGEGRNESEMSEWKWNTRDKALLRETWSDDFEDLYSLGSDIYIHIFNHNPACKTLFPWILKYETEGRDFAQGKEFRSQALRFVQTIAQVVKNVYHLERLEAFLYDIGQRHVQYASRGFKPVYWDSFTDAMQAALTNRMNTIPELANQEDRERAILIWRDIALFIIVHMKEGYNDGLKGINRFPSGVII